MRERARAGEGQREREGWRIQSGLCTDSRESDVELELTNHEIVTSVKVGCLTHRATQAPLNLFFGTGCVLFHVNYTSIALRRGGEVTYSPVTPEITAVKAQLCEGNSILIK